MIPYGHQEITDEDVRAVTNVLRSDFITQGPAVGVFERGLARVCKADRVVAVSSGTAALHLACRAVGLQHGGLLWTSPITFVASANCARYCGADVDFVDIEPDTANMSAAALARKLATADAEGEMLPDVVVPVHFGGASCDMAAIGDLAHKYGFTVIEDASHAVGGTYHDRSVGCCDHSRAAAFSFHPVKIVTTGEGGAVATNDAELAFGVELLRSHGVTRDPARMEAEPEGPWCYEQIDLGMNYRLTDIQAALGTSQLTRLDAYVARRRELAARYDAAFEGLPVAPLVEPEGVRSAFHLYVLRVLPEAPLSRRELFETLLGAGIGVNVHYIPVHLQPYYRHLGFQCGDFPVAEQYYEQAITLPLYPSMTEDEWSTVVSAVQGALT